ncbi:MAG TPA: right-handed parallel beta-helix repeat-containing protein [Steroidobacteraceae bacterium]|nr:right-handed parallel beta-helix repeat-containing protein [Steroidobacteraceae bacterium]
MRISARIAVAVASLVLLGCLAALGWWYQQKHVAPGQMASELAVGVTSPDDRGPGTLREALFVVASAPGKAVISIRVRKIAIETPLPPLVNPHGVRIVAQEPGAEIDAHALSGAPIFDVAASNHSLEGLVLRNCAGPAILLRAPNFQLRASTVDACDVGVDVAENASDVLLERNHFSNDRIGVRLAGSIRNTVIVGNDFPNDKEAGLWAVRGEPDRGSPVNVRENHFSGGRSGVVAGNVALALERNDFAAAAESAIHVLGAGVTVRSNHVSGGPGMGIVAENARQAIIDGNELEHLAAYGIMVRSSADTLVRGNRVHNCGYGLAFVLGDPRRPSTAADNTIIEPQFNGIDVVGDSPILKHNQVLQPHAYALHVTDFQPPGGQKVLSHPFLEGNNFRADGTLVASGEVRAPARQP